jgi:quercetin dioxygenase-like cupin family protein
MRRARVSASFTHIIDLAAEAVPPARGILSNTVFDDESIRAVVFGFAAGEELSEHTAAVAAVLHFISGEAQLTLGDQQRDASAGTWVHMPGKLVHSVHAVTPVVMLLLLLKAPPVG